MTDWPMVTIALTTYFPKEYAAARLQAAHKAISSWAKFLRYDGPLAVHWVDDGSDDAWVAKDIAGLLGEFGWQWRLTAQGRKGLGAALNLVFAEAPGPVLYAADDWELVMSQNLNPWVTLLYSANWNICAVRLGMLHPGVTGSMEMGPGCWFLRLAPHNVVCGLLRPSLIGQQFMQVYGPWPEGVSALAVEDEMNNRRYCPMQQQNPNLPGIALGLTEPWWHVDSVDLGEIRPGGV